VAEPAPVDVAALVAEIEAEVARKQASREYPEALLERLRTEFREARRDLPLDALAHIETVRPLESARPFAGKIAVFAKRVVRRLVAWYVRPLAEDQSRFNFAVLRELQKIERNMARLDTPWRRPPGAPAPQAGSARLGFDVAAARREALARELAAAPPGTVLVLEAGDGSLVEGLRERRVEVTGTDPALLAAARERGLRAHDATPLEYLEALPSASLAAIVAPAILSLLPASDLLRAVPLMASRLRDSGLLLVDGPDPAYGDAPRDPSAVDPAMLRWVGLETVALLCDAAGLGDFRALPVGPRDASGRASWYLAVARR